MKAYKQLQRLRRGQREEIGYHITEIMLERRIDRSNAEVMDEYNRADRTNASAPAEKERQNAAY